MGRKKMQDTENLISENKDLKDEETIVQVSKEDISNEVNTKEKDQQKSKKTVKRGRKKAEKDTKEEDAKDAEFKEPKKLHQRNAERLKRLLMQKSLLKHHWKHWMKMTPCSKVMPPRRQKQKFLRNRRPKER